MEGNPADGLAADTSAASYLPLVPPAARPQTVSHFELLEAPPRPDEVLMAKVQLGKASLRAPASSRLLKINFDPAELTGSHFEEPAIAMVDTGTLHVRTFVEEDRRPPGSKSP